MNIELLKKSMLFKDMSEQEIKDSLSYLDAKEKSFKKGTKILRAGSRTSCMGMVIQGSVTIESNDIWGNRTILSHVGKGQFFAETYSVLANETLLIDVVANEDTEILFLNSCNITKISVHSNTLQTKLLLNLLAISSHKNLALSGRSFHISLKTIRGRVMSYLNSMAIQKGSSEFDIPFDRQQLADYLNLDRSALSKELGKMQDDGILKVKKNHFNILS